MLEESVSDACNITLSSNSSSSNGTTDILLDSAMVSPEIPDPKFNVTSIAERCENLNFTQGTEQFQSCVICFAELLDCVERESASFSFYSAVTASALLLLPCFYCCFFAEENLEFRSAFEGDTKAVVNIM